MVALTGLALVATALGQQPGADTRVRWSTDMPSAGDTLARQAAEPGDVGEVLNIVVPKGAEAGDVLEVQGEHGLYRVPVPEGMSVSTQT